jgi:Fic family protein
MSQSREKERDIRIYANVDEQTRKELTQAMNETQEKKWYCRLKIIDLSGEGFSVPEMAALFNLSQHTIRNYIHRFNQGGVRVN